MSYQIITINREFESLGNEIAQAVSTKLCIPYYDKFLITAAAEKSGMRENRVEALDEKPESRFAYSQAEAAYYFTSADAPLPTGAKVAEVQFQLIRDLAAQGIHAGVEFRLNRAINVLGLPERQAKKVLRSTDKARKTYYQNYTGSNWNDPDLYHACLNPDRLGFDACVETICRMYQL